MIKLAKPVVTGPITSLINKSIETSIFPDQLKVAQVKPLFKNKNYQLDKTNYRPVSVLPAISKFLERTIFDQLSSFFENHLHPFLSAFRSGHGCQTALLKIIEDWKKALDDKKVFPLLITQNTNNNGLIFAFVSFIIKLNTQP